MLKDGNKSIQGKSKVTQLREVERKLRRGNVADLHLMFAKAVWNNRQFQIYARPGKEIRSQFETFEIWNLKLKFEHLKFVFFSQLEINYHAAQLKIKICDTLKKTVNFNQLLFLLLLIT